MKRKVICLLIAMMIFISSMGGVCAESSNTGECGDSLTWELKEGVLTISGTGDMPLWTQATDVPWASYTEIITAVKIEEGVTSIGAYAFFNCGELTHVELADSITRIENSAFDVCGKLTDIELPKNLKTIGAATFRDCKSLTNLTMYNNVEQIGMYAFRNCESLAMVSFNGTEEQWEKISIAVNDNDCLVDAEREYFAYVTLLDFAGNEISVKKQLMNDMVDISSVVLEEYDVIFMYKDMEMRDKFDETTPITENLSLYVDVIKLNELKIVGKNTVDIGEKGVVQSVTLTTDKEATHFVCNIKYPKDMILKDITSDMFSIEKEIVMDGDYNYLYLMCICDKFDKIPTNKMIVPFKMEFDVSETAIANDCLHVEVIEENTVLADGNDEKYKFAIIKNTEIKINPILSERLEIVGEEEIDCAQQYTVVVYPENTTNKEVEWTVSDENIATISQDGVLTPVKKGTVIIKATAKDGSGICAEKTVSVIVMATLASFRSNVGTWDSEYNTEDNEYIIYVPADTKSIELTAMHNGKLEGNGRTFINNHPRPITLSSNITELTLNYNCNGYEDNTYKIKIVKFEGTKTKLSEDGTCFSIETINVEEGKNVIVALYDDYGELVELQRKQYEGEIIVCVTDKVYNKAKIMVWDDIANLKALCNPEIITR